MSSQNQANKDSIMSQIKPFILGSLSGMTATCVIQPIDTIKVVIQGKGQGKKGMKFSPIAVGKQIIAEDGVRGIFVSYEGLYAGLDAALLRQLIYAGPRLGIYKTFEDKVKHDHNRNLTFGQKILYSSVAGAIGSAIANPTDLSLIRLQSDGRLPPQQRRGYKNVFDAIRRIAAQEGIRGLWSGSTPTVARAVALNCSQLVSYNQTKQVLRSTLNEKNQTMSIRLLSSALSGISVALISLPFDNVKTKIMKMKKGADGKYPYSGFFNCFSKSIASEGFLGLWVGLPTYYMRIAPHAMITVLVQDFLHDIFSNKHKH